MGKGGQNKKSGTLEHFPRLDSFLFNPLRVIPMCYAPGGLLCECGPSSITCKTKDGSRQRISLNYLPNYYGGEKVFFLCPDCGRRVRFLYLRGGRLSCRHCAALNYRCQQLTHDCFEPYSKAVNILRTKFKVREDELPIPLDLPYYIPPKPPWMRRETFSALCRGRYRQLQLEYMRAFLAMGARICGGRGLS